MKALDAEIELLRQRARAALAASPGAGAPDSNAHTVVDAMRLMEELRVYQTELEIQN